MTLVIVGVVVYWAVAFWFASRLGQWLKGPSAPPAGPRARFVESRERVGEVRILPSLGDAENARKWGRG